MLNVLNADESEAEVQKITELKPEEARRMKQWLEEKIAAGKKKPLAEVVTLTPVLAQLLLDRNANNRVVSPANSQTLAADIANKRFLFNGESIVISNTGVLIDGQHRCQQVIATGRPIETVLVFGPREESRFTIDIGKPKTITNFLGMKQRSYAASLGTVISYYLQWTQRGYIFRGGAPTKAEILTAADELTDADASCALTSGSKLGCHSVLAFCHYAIKKRVSRQAADEFIGRLIDGDNLRKGDPILYCRNRLSNMRGRGTEQNARIELIFKCWNAHRLNYGVDHCKITGGKLPKLER